MRFPQLIDGAEVLDRIGDAEVQGLQYDSRKVRTGDCFVAMKGETTDGNLYIDAAIKAGAIAVVSDSAEQKPREGVAWAQVTHGRRALARLSANLYGKPAEKLRITGITGTNGKTTTSFLLESILAAAGRRTARVGTIEYRIAGRVVPAPHTTPESLELNHFFADALRENATEAVMEVSSHALAQQRVFGIPFDVAVFSNLTRDHLDFHADMEDYFRSKSILFEGCGTAAPRAAIINQDDEYGQRLIKFARKQGSEVFVYGVRDGEFHARNVEIAANGTRLELATPGGQIAIFSPLVGSVNVYNILAAAGAAFARGCSLGQIADGVRALDHVPGRFQKVAMGQPFTVVVDYAHTDDALRNLTKVAREFVTRAGNRGRVITLFGCGGDRDRRKRPLMGKAAGVGSDFVVLTSDNPRSEDPFSILHDALRGLQQTDVEFTVEPDRARAIALAVRLARPGDIVLIAGKGHEKVQVTADGAMPFDDVEVASQALQAMGHSEPFRTQPVAGIAGGAA
ncbi:MAG: UDP-N-acetylmuramoyl-L-alanyl-D-glutamate--2,6-diaminopimelate ligase [Acidobacteriales bacterium]|nr:UDP-N-acetylmuramoyl-L-alanyl-D-glutamate--2,6-diaminopimelate ligase [Terriglobales bacterium]